MTLRTLALALASAATLAASPVIEYTFSQPGDVQASTGSSPAALQLRNSANAASDLTRTTVDGVAGAGDRYLDTQGSAGAYGQQAVSLPALSGVNQFTFAGWINTANTGQGGGRIFDLLGATGGYHLVGQPSGGLRLTVDGTNADAPAGVLEANTWVFVAVSYDGTTGIDNVRFYKGTRLAAAAEVALRSINQGATNATTTRLTIGKDDQLASGAMAALFDNLRFYDRVLAAAEVEALRAADAPPPPPAAPVLLLAHSFDVGSATQANGGSLPLTLGLADAAGQSRDLTGRSAPGVRGSGDRYLDLVTNPGGYGQHAADEDAIDALPAFTLSGWINTDFINQSGARLIDNFDNTSGFRLVGQPSGALRLVVDQLNATTGAAFLEAGGWIFFAVTYDGTVSSNNVRFYKGRRDLAVAGAVSTGTINAGAVGNDLARFTIGKDRSLSGNAFMGRYDNIRLHQGVLDAAALDALRAADVAGYVEPPTLGAVVDVTQAPYFADNTGATDSTAAIQSALSDNQFKNRTIFFPAGTYVVSRGLFISTDNLNAGFTHLRGASREGTVLRLRDNSNGTLGSEDFRNPAQPRAMLNFFVGPWTNNGYYHSVEDMTFDIGAGNPGAVGLEFQSNNVGWIENVTIRTSDPQRRGAIGLKIDRNLVGMGIARDVHVEGFDYGIRTGHYHAAFVFEDVSVANQRVAGLWNFQKPISLRRFTSHNTVPGIINTDPAGQIVVLESAFHGGSPTTSAIDNQAGYLFARDVTTTGYASAVQQAGVVVPGADIAEYVSSQRYTLWADTPPSSLNLPIQELPIAPSDGPADVYVVDADAQDDDTAAIQAGIDSGKTTVYLPLGTYKVSDTIRLRGNLRRLIGQQATIEVMPALRRLDKPVLLLEDGAQPTVWVERLKSNFQPSGRHTWMQHNASRDLVLRHVFIGYGKAYRNEGTGRLFMEDVAAGGANVEMEALPAFIFKDQEVWAWQFNPEGCFPHVINDGGRLWVFGFKVGENHGPYFHTVNGGQTELLGGVVNSLTYDPQPADRVMFSSDNSDAFVILVERPRPGFENPTPVVVRERRDQEAREFRNGDFPYREADYVNGTVVPYFRGKTVRGADLPVIAVLAEQSRLEEDEVLPARYAFVSSHALAEPLTVYFSWGGDAARGADFAAPDGQVTFAPGSTEAEVWVQPSRDQAAEDPETIELQILGDSRYLVAQPFSPAVVRLQDDREELTRGLLASYEFNGDVLDSSGSGNHGVNLGGAFESDGSGGTVLSLANGAYVQLAATADTGYLHDAFDRRSVALRFQADRTDLRQILFEEGGGSHGLGLRIIDGHLEAWAVSFSIPTIVRAPISAGRWHQATVTFDRGHLELHLDGAPVASAPALRKDVPPHRSAGTLGAGVGGDVFSDGSGTYAGRIDQVRYYTRVLNDREIRRLAGVARVDHLVAEVGVARVPLRDGDPGSLDTGLSLTSMGQLLGLNGQPVANVWRVRNGATEARSITLQNANGEIVRSFPAPARTDTFVSTGVAASPLLHLLRLDRRVLETEFPSSDVFFDPRLINR